MDCLEPVTRFGDHLDVGLTSSMRKPACTIHWSSATRTRMLMGCLHGWGAALSRKPPDGAGPAVISPP